MIFEFLTDTIMAILPINTIGDEVLNKVAKPVKTITPEHKTLIENMFETMYQAEGIGLAGPQVGKSLRVFVIDLSVMEDFKDEKPMAFINPQILETGGMATMEEGCLSVPGIREEVKRPEMIKIKYRDEDFKEHVEVFHGLKARVIQHEYEHLTGNLFVNNLDSRTKRKIKDDIEAIKHGNVDITYQIVEKPKALQHS